MGALDGRVAIITGAGRGIGREHALLFAAEGAKVVVNDLGGAPDGSGSDASAAEQVAAEIRAAGGEAIANHDDVADADAATRMVQSAIDTFGTLHVLVNNAGILRDRMVFSMSDQEWDAVVRVHLRGHFMPTAGGRAVLARDGQERHACGRLDHQHHIDLGPDEQPGPDELRRRKVGHRHVHRDLPEGARALRRALQCNRSGRANPPHGNNPERRRA